MSKVADEVQTFFYSEMKTAFRKEEKMRKSSQVSHFSASSKNLFPNPLSGNANSYLAKSLFKSQAILLLELLFTK